MEYTVKALADLAGVTPRTIRWYAQTGLLKPCRTTASGYRVYGPAEVDRLQTILFYRELDLPLSNIQTLLDDPSFDRLAALQSHLAELETRREHLDALILTVQKTIAEAKGGTQMTDQEKFEAFKRRMVDEMETQYGSELREKYSVEEVDSAQKCILSLTESEYNDWQALGEKIRAELEAAVSAKADPQGEKGRQIAQLHRRWLSYSWEVYTPQAHCGLAQLYTADPRFTAYYDRNRSGCAAFLRDAVCAHMK